VALLQQDFSLAFVFTIKQDRKRSMEQAFLMR
jgi:hypothetical protein